MEIIKNYFAALAIVFVFIFVGLLLIFGVLAGVVWVFMWLISLPPLWAITVLIVGLSLVGAAALAADDPEAIVDMFWLVIKRGKE